MSVQQLVGLSVPAVIETFRVQPFAAGPADGAVSFLVLSLKLAAVPSAQPCCLIQKQSFVFNMSCLLIELLTCCPLTACSPFVCIRKPFAFSHVVR